MAIDEKLVAGCRRRERPAQRRIYELTSKRVYGLILKMVRRPEDALDLTQDTYVKVFQRIGQYDGSAAFETWLYRIAVNEVQHFWRKAEIRDRHLPRIAQTLAVRGETASAHRETDLQDVLSRLRPEEQAILLLRYQQELSYQEIANVLGIAAGTVGSRLTRARDALRQLLCQGDDVMEENSCPAHPSE